MDPITINYNFVHKSLTICQYSHTEGSEPVTVPLEHEGESVSVVLDFEKVVDPETGIPTRYPIVNGQKVFTHPTIVVGEAITDDDSYEEKQRKLFEGWTATVEVVVKPLEQRPPREDGLKCQDCMLWDRKVGVEEFEKVTHTYENGEESMVRTICDTMATIHGKQMLNSKNVGYCPRFQSLCGDSTPGCEYIQIKLDPPAQEG